MNERKMCKYQALLISCNILLIFLIVSLTVASSILNCLEEVVFRFVKVTVGRIDGNGIIID